MVIRLSRLLLVTVSVLSFLGYFDHIHMLFELAANFKLQYFLASLLCFFPFLFYRQYAWLGLCVLCIAMNAVVILPWYLPPKDGRRTYSDEYLKIILSNVHADNKDYSGILMLVEKEKPDIVILQEVTSEWMDKTSELERHFPYVLSSPRDDNFGIAIFSKIPWKKAGIVFIGKANVPSILADMDINGKKLRLLGTHPVPPVNKKLFDLRNDQFDELGGFVAKQSVPFILAGDLNVTMWSSYYKKMIRETGLKNARKGFGLLPSWPAMFSFMMVPLDHFLYGPGFEVVDTRTAGSIGSDHLPVIVQFAVL